MPLTSAALPHSPHCRIGGQLLRRKVRTEWPKLPGWLSCILGKRHCDTREELSDAQFAHCTALHGHSSPT